jgi:hypothetical protein
MRYNRRSFVFGATAASAMLASAPEAQAVAPALLFEGFELLKGLFESAEHQGFQHDARASFDRLENSLTDVDRRLDALTARFDALPALIEGKINESLKRQAVAEITITERRLFELLRAHDQTRPFDDRERDRLEQLLSRQDDAHAKLLASGPLGYPFLARAYVTEAIVLRALADPGRFNSRKGEVATDIRRAGSQLVSFARNAEGRDRKYAAYWAQVSKSKSKRFYIGSWDGELFDPGCERPGLLVLPTAQSFAVLKIPGSYETGVPDLDPRHAEMICKGDNYHDQEFAGWPRLGGILNYKGGFGHDENYKRDEIRRREQQALSNLNEASKAGAEERRAAATYKGQSADASRIADRVASMSFQPLDS